MANSGTLTIRLPEDQIRRLEELAETTRRSSSALAAEAVANYLKYQKWKAGAIEEGLEDLRAGRVISHDRVVQWLDSWGTENELPPPE